MHKKVEKSSIAERARSRKKSERYTRANFEVVDYVLITGMMKTMQKCFDHPIFAIPGESTDDIVPHSASELLSFLVRKRLKFRDVNGFPPFSPLEINKQISKFLKRVRQERSLGVQEGRIRSEEGRWHIQFAEFVVLCEDIMFSISPSIGFKHASELFSFLCLGLNLCA
jgi:hypothetical protein